MSSTFKSNLIRSRHPLVHASADRAFRAVWGEEFKKSTQTNKLEDIAGTDYIVSLRDYETRVQCKGNHVIGPSSCVAFEYQKPNKDPGWLFTIALVVHWVLIAWWHHGVAVMFPRDWLPTIQHYVEQHLGDLEKVVYQDGSVFVMVPRIWLRELMGHDFHEVHYQRLNPKLLLPGKQDELPWLERVD